MEAQSFTLCAKPASSSVNDLKAGAMIVCYDAPWCCEPLPYGFYITINQAKTDSQFVKWSIFMFKS